MKRTTNLSLNILSRCTLGLAMLGALIVVLTAASAPQAGGVPAHRQLPAPVTDADFYDDGAPDPAKVELGRLLFFDKVLSGNQNISCATCHHPTLGTSDGLSLPLGEGPSGLGPERASGSTSESAVHERVPRNSPALFNLGAREFTRMFHDGRVEKDVQNFYESGFVSPVKWKLPSGLDNVLAAQAMFPVTSHAEMAGQKGENPVADARSLNNAAGPGGVWEQLAHRLQQIPGYVERFKQAFPDRVRQADDIDFVLAANAIAAFEADAFRADDSPFDRFLRGNDDALSHDQRAGMQLFYGKANCSSCHSGPFQTDQQFHAIAMPQIGPGKADGWNSDYWSHTGMRAFPEDFGRGRETKKQEDSYKFRTPSLRNVELTAPYGHAGSHATLEAIVRHHLNPVESLESYDAGQAVLPELSAVFETSLSGSQLQHTAMSDARRARFLQRDTWVQRHDGLRESIARANELAPTDLTDEEVAQLVAFLTALTDPSSRDLSHLTPTEVPSGLPVDD